MYDPTGTGGTFLLHAWSRTSTAPAAGSPACAADADGKAGRRSPLDRDLGTTTATASSRRSGFTFGLQPPGVIAQVLPLGGYRPWVTGLRRPGWRPTGPARGLASRGTTAANGKSPHAPTAR